MTIGIAAVGPRAGLAIYRALHVAEKIGTGAIGGFCAFAAFTSDFELMRAETQRGGTNTLFIDGERTGVAPPSCVAEAPMAALISSGPDRPPPLSQFLAASPDAGLVTGHRLPNSAGRGTAPLNAMILQMMRDGRDAKAAVDAIVDEHRESDAGFIAVDCARNLYARNTDRVEQRRDQGAIDLESSDGRAHIAILHNAIHPMRAIAPAAAHAGLAEMTTDWQASGSVLVEVGTPVRLGKTNALICDSDRVVQEVVTTDPLITEGRHICAAIYLDSAVYVDGVLVGHTTFEPIVTVEGGVIREMSGQSSVRMTYSGGRPAEQEKIDAHRGT